MALLKETKRTGKLFTALAVLSLIAAAGAAASGDIQFTAKVDRDQVGMDESVSLKLSIQAEGATSAEMPTFNAPDFEVVNEFTSTFVESYQENGRFGMRNTQQVTKVLRPLKTGSLRITNIRAAVGGNVYAAPDISVKVVGAGAGTPPPRGYGGGAVGLRGSGKRITGPEVFVRAEVDKDKAYKGEQVIISYYLYGRGPVYNIEFLKYPALSGFLREDLEVPGPGQRISSEPVVLDGVRYERSLLARYAAYPLQEGKLKIDPIHVRYNYQSFSDDPLLNFFRQIQPRSGDSRSEPITVDAIPLPAAGRPASFSGGVGDFSVTTAVNKYEVHANDAISLLVKVEGRGNVSAIAEPKVQWPSSIELYDSKGRAKTGRAGVGEKIFELLLIPREPGKVKLPILEFGFFDPAKSSYYTRTTEPIEITVLDPLPGSTLAAPKKSAPTTASSKAQASKGDAAPDEVRYLMPPTPAVPVLGGEPVWRWLYWLAVALFGFLLILVGQDSLRRSAMARASREGRQGTSPKNWENLKAKAKSASAGGAWQEVLAAYETLTGMIFDALDRAYGVGARSLPREELKMILVQDRGLSSEVWERISRLLEHGEMVRFASNAGAIPEGMVRTQLSQSVSEGEELVRILDGLASARQAGGSADREGSRSAPKPVV